MTNSTGECFQKGKVLWLIVVVVFLFVMITVITYIHNPQIPSLTESGTISNFGSSNYDCSGSCYCDNSVSERRASNILKSCRRLSSILIVAFSSYLAYEEAKRVLLEKCELECGENSHIHVDVESCDEIGDKDFNREKIEREVKLGFKDEQIIMSERCDNSESSQECSDFTKERIEEQKEEEKKWPEMTDCDRLDAAFAEINQYHFIRAEQNVFCKNPKCSHVEECGVDVFIDSMREEDVGVAWYHVSDIDLEGGSLKVWYEGMVDEMVGVVVVRVLRKHGLECEIDSPLTIKVKVDWKRRRE